MGNRQKKHDKIVKLAPCGECPKDKCDRCESCKVFAEWGNARPPIPRD